METSLNWLCPNFLLLPKKFSCPKFGGAAAPQPPARTPGVADFTRTEY